MTKSSSRSRRIHCVLYATTIFYNEADPTHAGQRTEWITPYEWEQRQPVTVLTGTSTLFTEQHAAFNLISETISRRQLEKRKTEKEETQRKETQSAARLRQAAERSRRLPITAAPPPAPAFYTQVMAACASTQTTTPAATTCATQTQGNEEVRLANPQYHTSNRVVQFDLADLQPPSSDTHFHTDEEDDAQPTQNPVVKVQITCPQGTAPTAGTLQALFSGLPPRTAAVLAEQWRQRQGTSNTLEFHTAAVPLGLFSWSTAPTRKRRTAEEQPEQQIAQRRAVQRRAVQRRAVQRELVQGLVQQQPDTVSDSVVAASSSAVTATPTIPLPVTTQASDADLPHPLADSTNPWPWDCAAIQGDTVDGEWPFLLLPPPLPPSSTGEQDEQDEQTQQFRL